MPKEMEQALMREAHKKGFSKEHTGAYVYGTMRKMGWRPNLNERIKKARKRG